MPTRVDIRALDRYCRTFPEFETFFEEVFLGCEDREYEENQERYQDLLAWYVEQNPIARDNLPEVRWLFPKIAYPTRGDP